MLVERRRLLRHKVHSPAYASIGVGVGGVVLDANERGAAIESVARLTPQSFVDLRLDLLDTHGSAVTPARVAWCDGGGRAGLEFLNLTGESRRQLQQWLLLNALLATEKAGELTQSVAAAPLSAALPGAGPQPEAGDDPVLCEWAKRAQACTEAHGAAIALADGSAIVCRATAGEIAPPPGAKLDTQSGISGACVRSGRWLRCDDPRLDPHVDRESCQALGIHSVLAVPIGEREDILGLVEVFSRAPYAFKENHCSALQELAKAVALSLRPQTVTAAPGSGPRDSRQEKQPTPLPPAATPVVNAADPANALVSDTSPAPGELPANGGRRLLLGGLVTVLVILGLWLLLNRGPEGTKNVNAAEAPPAETQSALQPTSAAPENSAAAVPDSLHELQQRAQAGDAEAEFELGAKYASGEDVAQDYAQAVKWFTLAANGGQVLAAATLGAYYWAGRGVAQDDVSAYMWSAIAKEGGDEASKYRLTILRARMTAAQISQAEQRAAAWRQSHPHLAGKNSIQP
ncbi:MAG: GAF domain-containing protein [Chlamydiota bacterium]